MFKIIRRVVRAPLTYLADLRKLTFKQYLMLHTRFSPSYPIMITTSLITTLSLAAFIIYFIITTPGNSVCFDGVRGGAYVISFMYPIQTLLCFICLTGTVGLSKNSCWKITWIILFGPLLCGFGFGELGLLQMCLLGVQNEDTFRVLSIIKQPSFIAAIVYLYIALVVLYFVLVPSIEYLYKRQKEDEQKKEKQKQIKKEKQKQIKKQRKTESKKAQQKQLQKYAQQESGMESAKKSCCSRFICILYYFLHVLFFFTALFIIVVKVFGPILFTYIWVEMATSTYNFNQKNQKIIFSLSLIAYFVPFAITILTLLIQIILKRVRRKAELKLGQKEAVSKAKQTIEITQGRESKVGEIELQNQSNINKSIIREQQKYAGLKIEKNIQCRYDDEVVQKQRRQSLI